jgi:serine protease AprX
MRYAIISKGLSFSDLKAEVGKVGGVEISETPLLKQLFCELTDAQVFALSTVSGLVVKPLRSLRPDAVMIPERVVTPQQTSSGDIQGVFSTIRALFDPAITGAGLTVAVIDSGIRKTHESLVDKVVYEANFSESPDASDVFGHGTQVAFVIAGGTQGDEKTGVSPGAVLMNIKVISDTGSATEEEVVLGINRVCELVSQAVEAGLPPTDPMYPNVINLSLGAEDDGDTDSPMRVACRTAVAEYGLDIVAAAGNYGPDLTTITTPGTEPQVITVGAIETASQVSIWEKSSRGPTKKGDMKPDFVLWGVGVEGADNANDTGYVAKSGTSFSTPMLSGLTGLLWETGRRVYGDAWVFKWTEARQLAPYYCLKPEDAPVNKDHDYGYGLPAVGTMVGRLATPTTPTNISNVITPMMLMMIIMSMMKMAI